MVFRWYCIRGCTITVCDCLVLCSVSLVLLLMSSGAGFVYAVKLLLSIAVRWYWKKHVRPNKPRSISCLSWVIVWVRVVFRKTVVGDSRFKYLSGTLQSWVKSCHQMVFMPLILVWNGQFCGDVIGHQNVRVAVNGRFLFCCYFLSVYCLLRYLSFVWGLCIVGSEVLVLSLCTSFLISVPVGSLCYMTHSAHSHSSKGLLLAEINTLINNEDFETLSSLKQGEAK